MIKITDDKKEFASILKADGDTDTLDYLRLIAQEFGPLPDDATVLYLRRREEKS